MTWRISLVAALVVALIYTPIYNILNKKQIKPALKNTITFVVCLVLVFCVDMLVSIIFGVE